MLSPHPNLGGINHCFTNIVELVFCEGFPHQNMDVLVKNKSDLSFLDMFGYLEFQEQLL